MALNRFHIASVLDQEIICVITVCIILGQITRTNRLINLDLAVFDFLGKISYGLYVIHPMVIFFLAKLLVFDMPAIPKYVLVYSLSLAATILFAHLSYKHFEKYFLSMKSRFSAVLSSSSRAA